MLRFLQWFFGIIGALAFLLAGYQISQGLDHSVNFGVVCVIAVMVWIILFMVSEHKEE